MSAPKKKHTVVPNNFRAQICNLVLHQGHTKAEVAWLHKLPYTAHLNCMHAYFGKHPGVTIIEIKEDIKQKKQP
uniref:Uncharacterized protein n=1 Tax=Melanopsichium pennsylvanicum 4 TaxID=1398559 RepID=A0A077QYC3_9BASI|nr:uncharacterized protein BN887_06323 [Melanopsichium pennsylvanicum 4]